MQVWMTYFSHHVDVKSQRHIICCRADSRMIANSQTNCNAESQILHSDQAVVRNN
jgi:hypothetical protein